MNKFACVAFLFGMLGMVGVAVAADPTGTWKWKTKFGKNEVEQTLKLEVKDGKATGVITGGKGGDLKIEDGKFKDDEITFTVTREFGKDKTKVTTKYSGKVSDDTIKGTITTKFGEKENKADWEAKREKK